MQIRPVALPLAVALLVSVPSTAAAEFIHVVAPGESLSSVAALDGLTVTQLASANGLTPDAELLAGSQLVIPPQEIETSVPGEESAATMSGESAVTAPRESAGSVSGEDFDEDGDGASPTASPSPEGPASESYVVQPGDTLSAIAARSGTTVAQLAAANGLDPSQPLLYGTTLSLGASSASETHEVSSSRAALPQGESQEAAGGPPFTTAQTVTPEEIASIASANGVSPALANAIAYMESGDNNGLTSSANARGVMQITPSTWSWIQRWLAGATPLAPASALDNVRGGVMLLHALLEAAGGDERLAIAGYYQGLQSVRAEGMYPSTEQYVDDVQALEQRFGG